MISVFTPCHKPSMLKQAFESLKAQTFQDFEWVILLNGEGVHPYGLQGTIMGQKETDDVFLTQNPIPLLGENYEKAKIYIAPLNAVGKIGWLKKKCSELAQGSVVVEMDCDDALTPDCLQTLFLAFKDDSIDFIYSSCYEMKDEKSIQPYSAYYGWKYEQWDTENNGARIDVGETYTVSFPPSPQSFGYIWYAPNHVRAWRKSFYDRIGGHDATLEVCDDHDLLCRTYIEGVVYFIQQPLYIYNHHDTNTSGTTKNALIQEMTVGLHDKYIERMVLKWVFLQGLKAVDVCCFANKAPGYIGIDKYPHQNVDIVFDLEQSNWPFEDGSVGVFRLQDAIEHMKDPINTMKEIYRCLAPNGWALIEVPSTDGRGAWQDPTHVSYWNSNSFWYYTRQDQAQYINTPVKFQLNRILNYFPSPWHEQHKILYTKAHLVKLVDGIVPPGGRDI
jgi:hypothetical protein